jgi:hypothetical protein
MNVAKRPPPFSPPCFAWLVRLRPSHPPAMPTPAAVGCNVQVRVQECCGDALCCPVDAPGTHGEGEDGRLAGSVRQCDSTSGAGSVRQCDTWGIALSQVLAYWRQPAFFFGLVLFDLAFGLPLV